MRIARDDLSDARTCALLAHHAATARAQTGRGSAHAFDLDALRQPDVRVWSAWDDDGELLGVGALRRLDAAHAEVKAMHVREAVRGRGVGTAIVRHIVAEARAEGLERLSLETGSWPYFAAARALYAREGFAGCAPFGDYVEDANSVFMTLALERR